MFSLFPAAYHQHPSYYTNDDYAYLDRDYFRALARQRAQEQREAQLEAARRQRAYRERLARRNSSFLNDFDDPYSIFLPSQYLAPHQDDLPYVTRTKHEQPSEASMQQRSSRVGARNHENNSKLSPGIAIPVTSTEPQVDNISNQPETREAAARKIQAFFRTAVPRLRSLRAIADISQSFTAALEIFRFPETLDFDDATQADSDTTPPLLFTAQNAPLHGHEHELVKLLSALDAVESHGDAKVREMRKKLVKRIEGALAELDAKKEMVWSEILVRDSAHRAETLDGGHVSAEEVVESAPVREVDAEPEMEVEADESLHLCEEDAVEKELLVGAEDDLSGRSDMRQIDEGKNSM